MFQLRYSIQRIFPPLGLGLFFLCIAVLPGFAQDLEPLELRRNPFDFSAIQPVSKPEKQETVAEKQVLLELRATLVAAEQSIANINGKHLVVGETIEGYQLLRVGEDEVILAKDGKRVTLLLQESPKTHK